ncbi:MAG: hypothetical protein M1819_004102 [Sarea resinae]|nr:MAG: hypothetical protein M1819_004102 [Sarea resinae]
MPPWILTSPSSRGLGLALTRHLLRSTTLPIIATARRSPAETRHDILRDLDLGGGDDDDGGVRHEQERQRAADRLTVLRLDVTDESSILAAAAQTQDLFPRQNPGNYLSLAFVVPGILVAPEKTPAQIDAANTLETLQTNLVGPMLMVKHFAPFLPTKRTVYLSSSSSSANNNDNNNINNGTPPEPAPAPAVWATMSARVGSITDNRLGGWYAYRVSKAGVNQLTKTFDVHLRNVAGPRAMAVALHPGTVKTGLSRRFWGGAEQRGQLSGAEEAAARLVDVVEGLREAGREGGVEGARGRCWDWRGVEVPP